METVRQREYRLAGERERQAEKEQRQRIENYLCGIDAKLAAIVALLKSAKPPESGHFGPG